MSIEGRSDGSDGPPLGAAQRLQRLRVIAAVESDVEARIRLARERPTPSIRTFAELASDRLRELRALCELTAHLHRAQRRAPPRRTT